MLDDEGFSTRDARARPMNRFAGQAILGLSGAGFPLTQLAIRRLGRPGALLVIGVTGGLLVRDLAMVAGGAPARLQPGPARMLVAETVVAAAATAAGVVALGDRGLEAARTQGWHLPVTELLRRFLVGTLFGLHTMRFRIFLAPGSGRRDA